MRLASTLLVLFCLFIGGGLHAQPPLPALNAGSIESLTLLAVLSNPRNSNVSSIISGDQLAARLANPPLIHNLLTFETIDLPPDSLGVSPRGDTVLAYDRFNNVSVLINLNTGDAYGTLPTQVQAHKFNADGTRLITRTTFPAVDQLWDVQTGDLIGELGQFAAEPLPPLPVFRPNADEVVISGVQVWNAQARSARLTLDQPSALGWQYSADGLRLLTWSAVSAQVWDAETAALLGRLTVGEGESIVSAALNSDASRAVVHALRQSVPVQRVFTFWDITADPILIGGHVQPAANLATERAQISISANGAIAALYSDQLPDVSVFDLTTGSLRDTVNLPTAGATSLILNADGQLLIAADQYAVSTLWTLEGRDFVLRRTLPAGDLSLHGSDSTLLISSFQSAYVYGLPSNARPRQDNLRVRGTALMPVDVLAEPNDSAAVITRIDVGNTPVSGRSGEFVFLDEFDGWVRLDPEVFRLVEGISIDDLPVMP